MHEVGNPSLSIITLNFNQGKFLEQNIHSVRSQFFHNFEHIVVDPGSTDGSRSFLERLKGDYPELRLIMEPDSGPAEGLNKGLEIARGDFVLVLNADDYLLPGSLNSIDQTVARFPNFQGYTSHAFIQNDILKTRHFQFTDEIDVEGIGNGSCVFIHPSIVISRSFLQEQSITFNGQNKTCWDLELICNVLKAGGKFKRTSFAWSVFRIHGESISGSGVLTHEYLLENEMLLSQFRSHIPNFRTYNLPWKIFLRLKRKILSKVLESFYR